MPRLIAASFSRFRKLFTNNQEFTRATDEEERGSGNEEEAVANQLPLEIWIEIFKYLPKGEMYRLWRTNRNFLSLALEDASRSLNLAHSLNNNNFCWICKMNFIRYGLLRLKDPITASRVQYVAFTPLIEYVIPTGTPPSDTWNPDQLSWDTGWHSKTVAGHCQGRSWINTRSRLWKLFGLPAEQRTIARSIRKSVSRLRDVEELEIILAPGGFIGKPPSKCSYTNTLWTSLSFTITTLSFDLTCPTFDDFGNSTMINSLFPDLSSLSFPKLETLRIRYPFIRRAFKLCFGPKILKLISGSNSISRLELLDYAVYLLAPSPFEFHDFPSIQDILPGLLPNLTHLKITQPYFQHAHTLVSATVSRLVSTSTLIALEHFPCPGGLNIPFEQIETYTVKFQTDTHYAYLFRQLQICSSFNVHTLTIEETHSEHDFFTCHPASLIHLLSALAPKACKLRHLTIKVWDFHADILCKMAGQFPELTSLKLEVYSFIVKLSDGSFKRIIGSDYPMASQETLNELVVNPEGRSGKLQEFSVSFADQSTFYQPERLADTERFSFWQFW